MDIGRDGGRGERWGGEKGRKEESRRRKVHFQSAAAALLSHPKAAGLFSRCHSSRCPQPLPCIPAPSNDVFGYCRDETAESGAASLTTIIIIIFPLLLLLLPPTPPLSPTCLLAENRRRRGGVSMVLLRKHKGIITHITSGAETLGGFTGVAAVWCQGCLEPQEREWRSGSSGDGGACQRA